MIQNYLRVARAGDRQNYHHWLTPFLKEVARKDEIKGKMKVIHPKNKQICLTTGEFAKINAKKPNDFCVEFLENLDTDLAYAQMSNNTEDNDNLLTITKQYLEGKIRIVWDENEKVIFDTWASNLNQGTGTPHYWFYRLEYYLWKDKEKRNIEIQIDGKRINFGAIADNYRFRGLNSIEHIQPQSKADEWKQWEEKNPQKDKKCEIDDFGNLALISQSFNSSLSNQDMEKKWIDIRKNKDVESLKMCLAYASVKGDYKAWKPDKAKEHQNEMLEILKASLGIDVENEE